MLLQTYQQDNDEFYELVFCKFLSDTSYSVAVQAAAARLLLSCHSAWTVGFSSIHLCHALFLLSPLNLFKLC
jgi:hypothetical protein